MSDVEDYTDDELASGHPLLINFQPTHIELRLRASIRRLTHERDDARTNARILADSWEHESVPPQHVLLESLGYPEPKP